jgi:hypothetical protein
MRDCSNRCHWIYGQVVKADRAFKPYTTYDGRREGPKGKLDGQYVTNIETMFVGFSFSEQFLFSYPSVITWIPTPAQWSYGVDTGVGQT